MSVTEEIYRNYPIKDWYELLRRKEEKSYYSDLPFDRLIKDLKGEIDELFQGIQKHDLDNIKEELADVLLNTQQVIQALIKRGLITSDDLKQTGKAEKEKIYQRQPYLTDGTKLSSRAEETALFKKLKEKKKPNPQLKILFDND